MTDLALPTSQTSPYKPAVQSLLIVGICILSLTILAGSLTKPLGHDEHMYCTGGVLISQGKTIYRDFSYVGQMPYHPLILAGLYKGLGTTYYLLTARIFSAVCDIGVLLLIVDVYRRIFARFNTTALWPAFCAGLLYVFNPFVDYANGLAWNHDAVVFCVCLSLWLFITTKAPCRPRPLTAGIIGALLTVAICMRVTTIIVYPFLIIMLLVVSPAPPGYRLKFLSALFAGSAIAAIWPVWIIIRSGRAFFLNLFTIPVLNVRWQRETGMFFSAGQVVIDALTTPAYLLLIVLAVGVSAAFILCGRKSVFAHKQEYIIVSIVSAAFFLIAFVPPTTWPQYLAPPVPFLIISLAYPLLYFINFQTAAPLLCLKIFRAGFIAVTIVTVFADPTPLRRLPQLFQPGRFVPVATHQISRRIIADLRVSGPILTLAPLYALEGGASIYPEFSAGPFAYRVADLLSSSDLSVVHGAGPAGLADLVGRLQPAAVIVGTEPVQLEQSVLEAVIAPEPNQWQGKSYDSDLIAFFRL